MGLMCFPETSLGLRNHKPKQRNITEKREPILKILCQVMIIRMMLESVITYAHFICEHIALCHTVPSRGNISIITLVLQS